MGLHPRRFRHLPPVACLQLPLFHRLEPLRLFLPLQLQLIHLHFCLFARLVRTLTATRPRLRCEFYRYRGGGRV